MPLDPRAPLCECGCGQRVKSKQSGVWARWRAGHNNYGNLSTREGSDASRRPAPTDSAPAPRVEGTQLSMLPDTAPDYDVPIDPS